MRRIRSFIPCCHLPVILAGIAVIVPEAAQVGRTSTRSKDVSAYFEYLTA